MRESFDGLCGLVTNDLKRDPRGLENVQGEWTLVSVAWNLIRMAKLYAVAV